ncbi:CinA family protein [Pontibacter sp. FD36]|uniref:Nicotinamide-nucleotide amidase n=1 Tax=Pontibacter lucknowensis TaxID=1077936 RepID=A0A1N6Y5T0_9BACT|nr:MULTISPECIES: CinA family protein [Pontibacter]EJF08269.1 decaheme cytochrome c MtrA [Pontibacter sp. BAB1700]MBF8964190.1 CinA family protein [Pontibacter sp. FD36]SIR09917.1 nicotinamide-nucleotide amidase [Pontibacter lucknowensis]
MNQTELTELTMMLKDNGLTIAFAESCTAGMLSSELVKAKGSSDVLIGSLVVYNVEAKKKLLGVKQDTLDLYTAESQQVTNEMVMGLKKALDADISVATTGLAGEGGSETSEKPVGTIFVSFLYDGKAEEFREVFKGNSQSLLKQFTEYVLEKLKGIVEEHYDR